ncbi:BQ5605_C048g12388 [Microbotryum silenes-dioicae]|uniref:BQ5605_C048g12388 protein n=1 Tax=Microbotryum silenes-dioicae TaxID=796604 RepID=A0A2X0PNE0_9BASI|nr:BQ5605_C048g12388 [Microbotryum silenes-dioicae]
MKMQGEGKIWWKQNKEELKALQMWSLFAAEVRARFFDSEFVLRAEHELYRTAQGSEPFAAYAAKLASRRATLGVGKDGGKIIDDDQFKRHLLHHANDLLYARTTSTAGFSLSTFSMNDLIGRMTTVASSLGYEWKSQVAVANSRNIGNIFTADPKLNMAGRTPLTADTRQECINEGRCFNGREMGHSIRECPKRFLRSQVRLLETTSRGT